MNHSTVKPYKTYDELVDILDSRGMNTSDKDRVKRKISQVGYYRLSGYWYPFRKFDVNSAGLYKISDVTKKPIRLDEFKNGTGFDEIFKLYLFDKKLRLLCLDAIERIEINIRTIIAHELGKKDPLAYLDNKFINPKQLKILPETNKSIWDKWLLRQQESIDRSRDDCIVWHKRNKKDIPFWVVVEAWDFGTISKYYEILNGKYQNTIAKRMGVDNSKALKVWLQNINVLRNRCAHHGRIWNQKSNSPLPVLDNDYFNKLDLNKESLSRMYGLISIIWYLVENIGQSSTWISNVSSLVNEMPKLPGNIYYSLGLGKFDKIEIEKHKVN